MFACEKSHTAIAELLISKGVDVEAKNKVRGLIEMAFRDTPCDSLVFRLAEQPWTTMQSKLTRTDCSKYVKCVLACLTPLIPRSSCTRTLQHNNLPPTRRCHDKVRDQFLEDISIATCFASRPCSVRCRGSRRCCHGHASPRSRGRGR
jgi:hypothetical protein